MTDPLLAEARLGNARSTVRTLVERWQQDEDASFEADTYAELLDAIAAASLADGVLNPSGALREHVIHIFASAGRTPTKAVERLWHEHEPRIGQAFFPVAVDGGGHTLRAIRVVSRRSSPDQPLDPTFNKAIDRARSAVEALLPERRRATVRNAHWEIHPPLPSNLAIAGGSVGLAALVAFASRAVEHPVPATWAFSAALDAQLKVVPVATETLTSKVAALDERFSVVRLAVSSDQQQQPASAALQPVRDASDLLDTVLGPPWMERAIGTTAPPTPAASLIAGRYDVIDTLGSGGMAEVLRVLDRLEGKEAALKVLLAELSDDLVVRQRFKQEAELMRKVRSPHVLSDVAVGETQEGRLFLRMRLLTGGTLQDRAKTGPSEPSTVKGWARDILQGLVDLQAAGVVHRDIKPSNVLLDAEGHAILADLGIARHDDSPELTRTLRAVGSLPYMAPETRVKGHATPASDIYSAALTLQELLTGDNPGRVSLQPTTVLRQVIGAMGADTPEERLSAREALDMLDKADQPDGQPKPIDKSPAEPSSAPPRDHDPLDVPTDRPGTPVVPPSPWPRVAAALSLLGAVAGGLFLVNISKPTPPQLEWTLTEPAFGGRYRHAMVAHNDKMWMLGGFDARNRRRNDVWSSTDGERWEEVVTAAPWSPRGEARVVSFNNRIWLLGGDTGPEHLSSEVWASPDGATWELITDAPGWEPRKEFDAAVFDDAMYVFGGWTGQNTLDAWRSEDGLRWTELDVPPFDYRKGYRVLSHRGSLWVIAGEAYGYKDDVWSFDGSSWSERTVDDEDFIREGFDAVVSDGRMWLLGGLRTLDVPLPLNSIFSSADGNVWEQAAPPKWKPRMDHAAVAFDGQIWLSGGRMGLRWHPKPELWRGRVISQD